MWRDGREEDKQRRREGIGKHAATEMETWERLRQMFWQWDWETQTNKQRNWDTQRWRETAAKLIDCSFVPPRLVQMIVLVQRQDRRSLSGGHPFVLHAFVVYWGVWLRLDTFFGRLDVKMAVNFAGAISEQPTLVSTVIMFGGGVNPDGGHIAENNTFFVIKFSARVFIAMSSEFTFGDNSDEFCIFRTITSQRIRSLRHWRCHDCTHIWADQGNQTVHTHATRRSDRQGESDCLITFWSKQEILRSIFRSMQCQSVVCESVERVHGVSPWLIRNMNRLCCDCLFLWFLQYVPVNLKQIDDILVPQIEEEIAEVSKSLDRVQQYPGRLLGGNRSVSWNRPFDPDLRRQSDVLVSAQFDAHARLFSVV